MSVGGFFKSLGHGLARAFSPGAIKAEASIASIVLPEFSPLIMTAANAIISTEATAMAAGVQNGTGTQKFAYALMQFGPVYDNWAKQNNMPILAENKNAFLQKTFELLQTLPAIAAEVTQPQQPVIGQVVTSTATGVVAPVSAVSPSAA